MESMTTELLTLEDVKKILRCSLPQVYKLADRGLIGVVRMPSASSGALIPHRKRG